MRKFLFWRDAGSVIESISGEGGIEMDQSEHGLGLSEMLRWGEEGWGLGVGVFLGWIG